MTDDTFLKRVTEECEKQNKTITCGHCQHSIDLRTADPADTQAEQTDDGVFWQCPKCQWITLFYLNEGRKTLLAICCTASRPECLKVRRALQSIIVPV